MSNILSGLNIEIVDTIQKEEINALLDGVNENLYTDWEYDFIMDVADKNHITDKQKEVISQIYGKYIDN